MQPQEQMQHVLDKLKGLPPERVGEVEDFIDFLSRRDQDRTIMHAAAQASEPALTKVWDNTDDAVYDDV